FPIDSELSWSTSSTGLESTRVRTRPSVRSDSSDPLRTAGRLRDEVELAGRVPLAPLVEQGVKVLVRDRLHHRQVFRRISQAVQGDSLGFVIVPCFNLL